MFASPKQSILVGRLPPPRPLLEEVCAERFRNFAERFRNRSTKFRNRSAQSLSETQRKMSSCFLLIPLKDDDVSGASESESNSNALFWHRLHFDSFEFFLKNRLRRDDQFRPNIVKIRAILAIFRPFENFCEFRFDRFDIPFRFRSILRPRAMVDRHDF